MIRLIVRRIPNKLDRNAYSTVDETLVIDPKNIVGVRLGACPDYSCTLDCAGEVSYQLVTSYSTNFPFIDSLGLTAALTPWRQAELPVAKLVPEPTPDVVPEHPCQLCGNSYPPRYLFDLKGNVPGGCKVTCLECVGHLDERESCRILADNIENHRMVGIAISHAISKRSHLVRGVGESKAPDLEAKTI